MPGDGRTGWPRGGRLYSSAANLSLDAGGHAGHVPGSAVGFVRRGARSGHLLSRLAFVQRWAVPHIRDGLGPHGPSYPGRWRRSVRGMGGASKLATTHLLRGHGPGQSVGWYPAHRTDPCRRRQPLVRLRHLRPGHPSQPGDCSLGKPGDPGCSHGEAGGAGSCRASSQSLEHHTRLHHFDQAAHRGAPAGHGIGRNVPGGGGATASLLGLAGHDGRYTGLRRRTGHQSLPGPGHR